MTSPRLATPILLAALVLAAARPARAQLVPSVDAGTSSITYGDNQPAALFTLTPSVSYVDSHARLDAAGMLASGELYGVASRGAVNGALITPSLGPFRFEIGGSTGWDGLDPGATTGWWRGEARARWDRHSSGLWLAAGAGRALDANSWHPVTALASGAWLRLGRITFSASLENSRALDVDRPRITRPSIPGGATGGVYGQAAGSTTGGFYSPSADSGRVASEVQSDRVSSAADSTRTHGLLSQTDAQVALHWQRGPLRLELSVGRRFSGSTVGGTGAWGGARAMYWLSDRVALVADGGTLPSSLTEGRPASRYMTFGLHYGRRPAPRPAPPVHAPRRAGAGAGAQAGVELGAAHNGVRSLSIRLPALHSVEIMADFTEWNPVALVRDATGAWVVSLPIAPGVHHINVRVDGGAWRVPPGLGVVSDDFNGTAGLLVVP